MPTYLYRCNHGHEFEVEQRITDEPLQECLEQTEEGRQCAATCKRQIAGGTSIALRGSGWAKDGYSG